MRKGSPSILPNSSSEILAPMAGGLRVRWHDEMDSHVLYHGENRIASHHNGFSCHNLAKRMLAGDPGYALAQFDYITACGGEHYITKDAFLELVETVAKVSDPRRSVNS